MYLCSSFPSLGESWKNLEKVKQLLMGVHEFFTINLCLDKFLPGEILHVTFYVRRGTVLKENTSRKNIRSVKFIYFTFLYAQVITRYFLAAGVCKGLNKMYYILFYPELSELRTRDLKYMLTIQWKYLLIYNRKKIEP